MTQCVVRLVLLFVGFGASMLIWSTSAMAGKPEIDPTYANGRPCT